MKKLFRALVNAISDTGNICEASLYSSGKCMTLSFEFEGEVFNLTIIKEDKKDGNDND